MLFGGGGMKSPLKAQCGKLAPVSSDQAEGFPPLCCYTGGTRMVKRHHVSETIGRFHSSIAWELTACPKRDTNVTQPQACPPISVEEQWFFVGFGRTEFLLAACQ